MKLICDLFKLAFVFMKYLYGWLWLHSVGRDFGDNKWLITEKRLEARDNGYHFYKFLVEQTNEDVYYGIVNGTNDAIKVQKLGKIVDFNSVEHCKLYIGAKYYAFCQIDSKPYEDYRGIWLLDFFRRKDQIRVYLKHGIAKDYVPKAYDYRIAGYDIFICGARPEYEYYQNVFHYPLTNIALTGLCRYDGLYSFQAENTMLIMPTFRDWLRASTSAKKEANNQEKDKMESSEYFRAYISLLNNSEVIERMSNANVSIMFYLHYTMQPYIEIFRQHIPCSVVICDRDHYDVQDLLRRAKYLVTDYSSVAFDFAYMEKDLAYYQFDSEKYREEQYKKGYFDYSRDGFGPVYTDENGIVEWISSRVTENRDQSESTIYQERRKDFFQYFDNNNSKRVYERVLEYKKQSKE